MLIPIDPGPAADGWKPVVFAQDQPEYKPLPALLAASPEGYVVTAWSLPWRQRIAVLFGANIYLTLLSFHRPLMPVMIDVGRPEWLGDQEGI